MYSTILLNNLILASCSLLTTTYAVKMLFALDLPGAVVLNPLYCSTPLCCVQSCCHSVCRAMVLNYSYTAVKKCLNVFCISY